MSIKRITPNQRFSRAHPCPVCGGHKDIPQGKGARCYGWSDDDEKFVHCTREEFAGGAKYDEESQTFLHVRNPDGLSYRPWTAAPPTLLRPAPPRSLPASRGTRASATTAPPEHGDEKTHPRTADVSHFAYGPHQRIERKDQVDARGNWTKDCFSQHLANGTWSYGDGDGTIERIYRRTALAAHPDASLYLFEGERKADSAQAIIGDDGVAISWRGGCGQLRKSLPAIVEAARGRDVVMVTDCDREGRDAMQTVAESIHGIAQSVRLLDLYGDESKRDIEDWIHEGGTKERLGSLVAETEPYEPEGEQPSASAWDTFLARRVDLFDAIENGIEEQEYLAGPVLLKGKVHCIFGGPEQGKTMLLLHLVLQVLRSGKRVMMLDEEIGTQGTAERLRDMGATADDLDRLFYFPFATINDLDEMAATIIEGVRRAQIDLVTLDSISKALNAASLAENDNTDNTTFMRAWVTPVTHICGATVLYLDHTTKADDDGSYSRGASSKLADTDVQWHIKAAVAPSRTSIGRLVLTRKKDRWATVPAKVTYLAGGDGTGAIKVGLESSEMASIPVADERLRGTVAALHEAGERRYNEWARDAGHVKPDGSPNGTFERHVRDLREIGHVAKSGEQWHVTQAGRAAYFSPENEPDDSQKQTTPMYPQTTPTGVNGGGTKTTPTTPNLLKMGVGGGGAAGDNQGTGRERGVPLPAPLDTGEAMQAYERVCAAIAPVRRGKADGTGPVSGTLRHDARMAGLHDVEGESVNGLIDRLYGAAKTTPTTPVGVAERAERESGVIE